MLSSALALHRHSSLALAFHELRYDVELPLKFRKSDRSRRAVTTEVTFRWNEFRRGWPSWCSDLSVGRSLQAALSFSPSEKESDGDVGLFDMYVDIR